MSWPDIASLWQKLELLGLEGAWICDHLIHPGHPRRPFLEGWTLLAALAAVTHRIRIGLLVSSTSFRHPAVLAKEATTVDHISNGRLEVGLGAGWYEPEHTMFGISFPDRRLLVGRFEEAVQIIDLLLRQGKTSFDGRHFQVREAEPRPAPIQKPRPPLMIGAFGPRMLRITARHADAWNGFGSTEEMRERNALLDHYCLELGRNPSSLERSLYYRTEQADSDPWGSAEAFGEVVNRYSEVGMNHFIFDSPREDQMHILERVAGEVLPKLRGKRIGGHKADRLDPTHLHTADWKKPQDYI